MASVRNRLSVAKSDPGRSDLRGGSLAVSGIAVLLVFSLAHAQSVTQTFSPNDPVHAPPPRASVTEVANTGASVGTAASTAGPARERAATEGSTVPYRYPLLDPAKALTGTALLAALKKGGLVMYMRHTQTGNVTAECERSNLTAAGERDARFVGESIKTLRIPIGKVVSSPVCRVLDSAKFLGLGEPILSNGLSNQAAPAGFDLDAARGKLIAELPARGNNTLLVSHMQSGKTQSQWIYLDFGEIIVYGRSGNNEIEALARIRADDWYELMALEKK
ncbi:MAG: hypothetical protein ABL931_08275 [Usitatibacteraceae bacterium]